MPLTYIVLLKGTAEQKDKYLHKLMTGEYHMGFGLTEPGHGSDATHMDTYAKRDGDHWIINGGKTWNSGVHIATHDLIIARTSGKAGDARGLSAFIVPVDAEGFKIEE
jgi:acyl-CoA dehydrogenase